MEYIQGDLGKLVQLETLVLRDNKLRFLPLEVCNLIKLKVLLIQGNKIEWLPPTMSKCAAIQTMKLSGNPLANVLVKQLVVSVQSTISYLGTDEYLKHYEKAAEIEQKKMAK
jgi:Leucine-rich repeat (LRR) protein